MSARTRLAYLACTLLVAAAGCAATALRGGPVAAAATGAGLAWLVQAPAAWTLAAGLERGRKVRGRWAAGIGARVAGIGAAALAGPLLGAGRGATITAYGAAMVAFLLLEAGWLWRSSPAPGGASERRDTGPGDTGPRGASEHEAVHGSHRSVETDVRWP